tara:strand:+ start:3675 stop:4748 length:1074 start_codon:yes stop_codon:yes gene_type:complete
MTDSPKNTNSENIIKEKKKRGRKPKPKPENVPPKEPKKRGRKPKLKIVTPEDKNKFVLPSKRGRKPKDKTIILDKNLNLDSISNVILHLPIPLEKINDMDDELSFKYNPKLNNPNPYDPTAQTIGESTLKTEDKMNCIYEIIDEEKKEIKMKKKEIEPIKIEEKIIENMNNIENKINNYNSYVDIYYNNNIELNNIKCNWCLHECENEIIKLPYSVNNGVFNMYGNFCCPECAAAFNFNELEDEYVWERYSLLNYLYNPNNEKYNIAPSRLVLDIFGGPLSIEEYRNIIKTKKNLNIIMPPLYILKPQIEINKTDDIYIPLNVNRVNKYTTDLKLKRNKIKTKTNTLDLCMNLKCSN